MTQHDAVDLSLVKTYPLAERKNMVSIDRHFAAPATRRMSVASLLDILPDQLGARGLRDST